MFRLPLLLLFAGIALVQTSCEEPLVNTRINYYMTITDSDTYNHLEFDFLNTRAYQSIDGEAAIRSVYLDPQALNLRTNGSQVPVFLGYSDIEKSLITGYDFALSNASIEVNGERVDLDGPELTGKTKAETFIKVYEGDFLSVLFVIDVDNSITQVINNADTSYVFAPKILVEAE
ncbi:MAG: hypothetical protein KDC34_18295 [Saprospiraceae bacterium]|nr:hypothetical protein [Saprospiraceae bacterium]